MNNIPTAKELFEEYKNDDGTIALRAFETAYKKGCKLHVKAALKAAYEESRIDHYVELNGDNQYFVERDSILNAYPLKNIK